MVFIAVFFSRSTSRNGIPYIQDEVSYMLDQEAGAMVDKAEF